MKHFLRFIVIVLLIALLFVGLDSGTALLKKTAPFIHWHQEIKNGEVDKTLFYDIYYCYNLGELESTEFVFKNKTVTCPDSDTILTEKNLNIYNYKGFFNKKQYLKVINTNEELKEAVKYIKPYNKKYDEEFFNKNSILLAYIPVTENSIVKFKQIKISEEVEVTIDVENSKVDRDSNTGYAFFIEIDREYLGDKKVILES